MKGLLESLGVIKLRGQKWPKMLVLCILSLGFLCVIKGVVPEEKKLSIESEVIEKKGFDLFDEVSFLKGEKELHVLEMRALKGELEKELVLFENIQSARVILELQDQERGLSDNVKSKASLLLTLKPDAHLTCSELRAISCHVASGVRGLEPSQIAISDTTGRFYQGFEGMALPPLTKIAIEEDIEPKIGKIVSKLWGENQWHLTVNMNLEEKVLSLSLLLDGCKEAFPEEVFKQQIAHLIPGIEIKCALHAQPFYKIAVEEKKSPLFSFSLLLLVCILLLSISALILFSSRFFQKKPISLEEVSENSEDISGMMKKVNFATLSSLIQEQPPSTIALMLSYLDKDKQEALLSKLPESVHDEVMFYLTKERNV